MSPASGDELVTGRPELEQAIAAQERLRGVVPDSVIDAAIDALRGRLGDEEAPGRPGKRRTQVTVLFADVSGSTAMSETMDPEDVSDTFDALWHEIDGAITAANGRIDKHIGDAVMAVWGAEAAREDDPIRAVTAALAIQEAVARFRPPNGGTAALGVRVGVNTGPVLVGDVGTTAEFTAMGDTVNVASRLEQAAPVGGVLIGRDTYRHVRGLFRVEPQPPLTVKGKTEPLITYLVTGELPRPFRQPMRGIDGIASPMVGRDAELGALRDLVDGAMGGGRARLVTVVGEAGIGKSRLLAELEERLGAEHLEAVMLRGRADPPRELVSYGLMRDVWFQHFEITEHDAGAEALAKLEAGFGRLFGPQGYERAHLVGHLIGLDVRSSTHLTGILADPRQIRDRAFGAVAELVTASSPARGVVMLLEDLHWADQGSLDLVEHLARACATTPLAIVATARPALYEKRPGWAESIPDAVRLDLTPLPESAAGALVGQLLSRVADLPDTVRTTIVDTADGNPYYVEEIVETLIEDGAIDTGAAEWRFAAGRLGDLRVPTTLTGLLQARLDRLSAGERTALQQASVVGRTFWDQAVLETRGATDPPPAAGGTDVAGDLAALEGRQLVFEHARSSFAGAREFTFKHALLRDVAYESVLKRLRTRYHGAVAGWLAAQPDADARAATIARHYELAGAADCCRWYVVAGNQARLRYANDDAIRHYRRALDIGELDLGGQMAAHDGLVEVLMLQARYDEALDEGRAMEAVAAEAGDATSQARALAGISFVQSRRGANHDALASAGEAVRLLRATPGTQPRDLADALLPAGWAALRLGDLPAALRFVDEARELAARGGDRRTVARALNLQSLVESALGDHGAAITHLEEGLAIDRERGDRRAESASLVNLGEHARMRGDYVRAAARYEEALAIQRELGDHDMEALSMSNLGGAHVGLGDHRTAVEYLLPALDAFGRSGASEYLSETHRFLAEARLGLGDVDAAMGHAWQALETAVAAGNPEQTGHAWRTLGMVAARRTAPVPSPDGAEMLDAGACFARSVAVFADAGLERERAMALADWATWERAHAAPDAERRFGAARGELERLGLELLVEQAVAAFERAAVEGA